MSTPEQIQKALSSLDVNNDNHWTADGLPRLETVKLLSGDQSITRESVTSAAPGFSRASALQAVPPAPPVALPPAPETAGNAPAAVAPAVPAVPAAPVTPAAEAPVSPVQAATIAAATGLPPVDATINPNPLASVPVVNNTALLMQKSEQLTGIEKELEELNRARVDINARIRALQSTADDLRIQIEKLTPANSNQQAIQAYLQSRREALNARAEQISKVRQFESELGVRLSDLAPKRAPIDVAMARRTGHGLNRPK